LVPRCAGSPSAKKKVDKWAYRIFVIETSGEPARSELLSISTRRNHLRGCSGCNNLFFYTMKVAKTNTTSPFIWTSVRRSRQTSAYHHVIAESVWR